jgi:hypothetical protein
MRCHFPWKLELTRLGWEGTQPLLLEGETLPECTAAWDIVEELQTAVVHQRNRK